MNPDHNPDHTIDRVLQGLRDAKPPAGMDRRILNILEAEGSLRDVIPSEEKRRRGTPVFETDRAGKFLRWGSIATAAALFVAAIIVFATRHHKQPDAVSIASPVHQPTPPPPVPSAFTAQPTQAHRTSIPVHTKQISTQIETPSQPTQEANDALLSHPAPPIPPTEQERLLLRYARRGNTNDLAQITNEKRADRDQKDAADFQAFFTPPEIPLGESE